jgi:hypothetical protein
LTAPTIDLSFPHRWQAEVLAARPAILPARHYVYPRDAEEVERGALEVMVQPEVKREDGPVEDPGFPPFSQSARKGWGTEQLGPRAQPFLATCALGFRDPAAPTGLWAAPNAAEICAVSGGYAYVIDTAAPERFTMIPYRPVLEVRALPAQGLLLFVGHHAMLAWGTAGEAWQTEKLSDEGVTITGVEDGVVRGMGWEMRADRETAFAVDLRTGRRGSLGG